MTDVNPDNPDGDLPELESLHKVLPTGGPLLPGHPGCKFPTFRCTRCGMLSTTPMVSRCLKILADRHCPMELTP